MNWRGTASGSCDRTGSQSSQISADLAGQGRLAIDVRAADSAVVTLTRDDATWVANYPNGASGVVTIGGSSTLLRSARLAGDRGAVVLTASFDC